MLTNLNRTFQFLPAIQPTFQQVNEINSQIQFTQHNNQIHISTLQKLNKASVLVYDLLGKEILTKTFSGNETSITIDKKGIYLVEVRSGENIFRKKVFVY